MDENMMNFVRYMSNGIIELGDVNPKRLQKMVDGYRNRGYIVDERLSLMCKDDRDGPWTVWYKQMLLPS